MCFHELDSFTIEDADFLIFNSCPSSVSTTEPHGNEGGGQLWNEEDVPQPNWIGGLAVQSGLEKYAPFDQMLEPSATFTSRLTGLKL